MCSSMIEKLETLNQRLIDTYGVWVDGRARYRIVFSEDEIEKRWTKYTKEGLELQTPEVVELPKYRQWINPPCHVLEQLTEIPEGTPTDLTERISYEPLKTFRTSIGEPLIPIWPVIAITINQVLENIYQGRKGERRYKDPREDLTNPEIAAEARLAELNELEMNLFGNEGNPLSFGQGIVVPNNYGD